ncbi:PAS domain S-box-containing protein [Aquimonas voraii]|uniref:histidine kinase n=1 Tax=Aquimonas voraii TaxID=265719 RepID=A0A1G6ZI49_9GAMM|nr:ATP-binding protein [Aquimonas voraii]SDE01967.1 PAS domain S-box-containing protein [Aquimonas voraii]
MRPDPILEAAERACAEEPIHRLGRSQSHGVILVCKAEDASIAMCSMNAESVLGIAPQQLLGRALARLSPRLDELARGVRAQGLWPDGTPMRRQARVALGPAAAVLEASVHAWDAAVIVELQPTRVDPDLVESDAASLIDSLSQKLAVAASVVELCDIACAEVQRMTGYQRVMAYEFDADWNGKVIAEQVRAGEPTAYLGLQFPASDIPPQARRLYASVHLRVIADADDEGMPLVGIAEAQPAPDLSHALLRSVSPMHLQYLRNMGVRATLAISLLVDGRLWGLLVAHDELPRVPPHAIVHALRVTCRVMGQMVGARLLALDYRQRLAEDQSLLDLIEGLQSKGSQFRSVAAAWQALKAEILAWFMADGGLLVEEGRVESIEAELQGSLEACVVHFMTQGRDAPLASSALAAAGVVEPGSAVSGALWIPFGRAGSGLLLWRREEPRSVFWGGDPNSPMEPSGRTERLGPRRSFAKWREVRRDESRPWSPAQLEAARRLGVQWRLLGLDEERRRAEHTVCLLQTGIMHIPDGLAIARGSADGRLEVLFANPPFDVLLNQGKASVGKTPAFLDGSWGDDETLAALRDALGRQRPIELEFAPAEGRWLSLSLTPTGTRDGEAPVWVALVRNISARKWQERAQSRQSLALQRSNDRYARILEASHDGMLTLDEGLGIDYCSPRLYEILEGYQSLVGRPFPGLFARGEDAEALISTSSTRSYVVRRESALRDGHGRERLCDIAMIPLRRDEGDSAGWLVMVSDISQRKALEDSLRKLNARLEAAVAERTAELVSAKESADAANRAKSEFLANMSHELRSPLHGILGFTRLLIDDPDLPEERQLNYLGKVERNAANLLLLVNDLLDSAKIEAHSFSIQRVHCDLVEIARAVAAEFQVDTGPASTIRLDLPGAAPCLVDPVRMAQVLRNLLANAVRFSPACSRIDVRVEGGDAGWRLLVLDCGPGIPADELESIFERFSQSSGTKTGAGGTGLGLQIARGICESHGGWLRASNRAGGGAEFEAWIPSGH